MRRQAPQASRSAIRSAARWRAGCASAALALALATAPVAHGQGFVGRGTVVGGDAAAQIVDSANHTDVLIHQDQVVIDWSPSDLSGNGAINFLPNGNSATYQSQGIAGFTVLNRVIPYDPASGATLNRAIALNGLIQSRVDNAVGGNVWFYSPGGILVGSTGVFDVGGLVLTSNAIDVTNGLYGGNGEIRFRGASGSLSAVSVARGANIKALATGSYVALVAPRVEMSGTVNVDGSAAYVGAEQADVRINNGLFDIAMTVGTGDAHGVVHDGTTTGPATTDWSDYQRIYMVAMPKNQAMTMLLSGNIGYTPAATASNEGGAVVLSAGYDISYGSVGSVSGASSTSAAMTIGASTISSDLSVVATGRISLDIGADATTRFQQQASFQSLSAIDLRTYDGGQLLADEGLSLTAKNGATGGTISMTASNAGRIRIAPGYDLRLDASGEDYEGAGARGGSILLRADNGVIEGGGLTADASAYGNGAQGGSITLAALGAGGRIRATQMRLDANGIAYGASAPVRGGSIDLGAFDGGTLVSDTFLSASARADGGIFYGSNGQFAPMASGGATGGAIRLTARDGVMQSGSMQLYASARAASVPGASGPAQGGTIDISIDRIASANNGAILLTDCGSYNCYVDATADGASGQTASDGTGGAITLANNGGELNIAGWVQLDASGRGGLVTNGDPAPGGTGRGGSVAFTDRGASTTIGELDIRADGYATSYSEGSYYAAGDSGDGIGGTVDIVLGGKATQIGTFRARADGEGGYLGAICASCESYTAGDGRGGAVNVLVDGGGSAIDYFQINADGWGGSAASGYAVGDRAGGLGHGVGGTVRFTGRSGSLDASSLSLYANGYGGSTSFFYNEASGVGGSGTGGAVLFLMEPNSSAAITLDNLFLYADGSGGAALHGGDGIGGRAEIDLAGGALTTLGVDLSADGDGASGLTGVTAGKGGVGRGGTALATIGSAGHQLGVLDLRADGQGGMGGIAIDETGTMTTGDGGAGGDAFGGTAQARVSADLTLTALVASAEGQGGDAGYGSAGGFGGKGSGGRAGIIIDGGSVRVTELMTASATGQGGDGGAGLGYRFVSGIGGDGVGGSATISVKGSSTRLETGVTAVSADAESGATPTSPYVSGGGAAKGGSALFSVTDGASLLLTSVTAVSASASSPDGNEAAGGQSTGGIARFEVVDATVAATPASLLLIDASAVDYSATAGSAQLALTGGNVDLNNVMLSAIADGNVDGPNRAGEILITRAGGGTHRIATLSGYAVVTNGGQAGNIRFEHAADASDLDISSALLLTLEGSAGPESGTISFALNGGAIRAGSIMAATPGAIDIRLSGTGGLASATDILLTSGTTMSFSHDGLPAGLDSISAAGSLYFTATGAVTATGDTRMRSGSASIESLEGSVELVELLTGTSAYVGAHGGNIFISRNLGGTGLASLEAVGDIDVHALGDVGIANAITGEGRTLRVQANGGLSLLNGVSGTMMLASGGAMRLDTLNAAGDITARATGRATLNGAIRGRNITLSSADIAIGERASLFALTGADGAGGLLTLNATGNGATFIGGQDPSGGYSLSASEIAALHGRNITLTATGMIEIGDFAAQAGAEGQIGAGGALSITTPGAIRVNGAVQMNGMARDNQLILDGAERILVDAATGSIDLRGEGPGGLGGHLLMRSAAVYVATAAAMDDISALTDIAAIDARLAQNDGVVRIDNIIRANDITLDVVNDAFVQNVGASTAHDDRRGLLASTSTLEILTGSDNARIVINGQLLPGETPTMPLSGKSVAPSTVINGIRGTTSGRFHRASTINGCLIANPQGCGVAVDEPAEPGIPNADVITAVLDPDPITRFIPPPVETDTITLQESEPMPSYAPLIDDPVTGVGNEDLWQCANGQSGCGAPTQ